MMVFSKSVLLLRKKIWKEGLSLICMIMRIKLYFLTCEDGNLLIEVLFYIQTCECPLAMPWPLGLYLALSWVFVPPQVLIGGVCISEPGCTWLVHLKDIKDLLPPVLISHFLTFSCATFYLPLFLAIECFTFTHPHTTELLSTRCFSFFCHNLTARLLQTPFQEKLRLFLKSFITPAL